MLVLRALLSINRRAAGEGIEFLPCVHFLFLYVLSLRVSSFRGRLVRLGLAPCARCWPRSSCACSFLSFGVIWSLSCALTLCCLRCRRSFQGLLHRSFPTGHSCVFFRAYVDLSIILTM